MVKTIRLPGFPASSGKVAPVALDFISDLIYSTFYSTETGIDAISPATAVQDIEAVLKRNIDILLESKGYSSSGITSASVTLFSKLEGRTGTSLLWKVNMEAGRKLITADLEGSVLYKIGQAGLTRELSSYDRTGYIIEKS